MSNNINVTPGSGKIVAAEDISGVIYQQIKVLGGQTGSTSVMGVNPDGSIPVSILGRPSISGTVNIGIMPGSVAAFQATTPWVISSIYGNVSGSVAAFQAGTRITSVIGGPITLYAPTASFVSGVSSIVTSTSQTSVLATAPGAQRYYITQILVSNGATAGTFVDIMDGPNILWSGYAAQNGGGYAVAFPSPLKQNNTVQSLDMKARTQASVIVAINGFTAA